MGPGGQDLDYLAGDWLYRLSLRSICIMYTYVPSTSSHIIRAGRRPENLRGGQSVIQSFLMGQVLCLIWSKFRGWGQMCPLCPLVPPALIIYT